MIEELPEGEEFDEKEYPEPREEEDETAPCPKCGESIHEEADRCPKCGEYVTAGAVPKRGGCGLLLGVAILLACCGIGVLM